MHGCSMVESSVPRPRVSWRWICSGFPPSWSVLLSVEPPCWCGNALPLLQQDLAPALARCWLIIYSLTRQRERCLQDSAWEDMPGAHPHPTACCGLDQLHSGHFCIRATSGKSLDIFFPLTYGSAARFFPSILSLSLPGWLNELFSLLLALTFLCAGPWASGCCWQGERAGRGCPCREAGVGCAQHRKRLGTGELPALGSFSSLN